MKTFNIYTNSDNREDQRLVVANAPYNIAIEWVRKGLYFDTYRGVTSKYIIKEVKHELHN